MEAVNNLLSMVEGVQINQVEYCLSRYLEQGMTLETAAGLAFNDLESTGRPAGQQNTQSAIPSTAAAAAGASEENAEEEEEEMEFADPPDLPELHPQERRPPIPVTPEGWKACWCRESKQYYYWNRIRNTTQWEWPLEGVPDDMSIAMVDKMVHEMTNAAGVTEFKAKVKLMLTGFDMQAAMRLIQEEQQRMQQVSVRGILGLQTIYNYFLLIRSCLRALVEGAPIPQNTHAQAL
ncbi:unnamed protein product [Symbiodinium natans]|uniref:WW domain-containing protein n=1 Tax=Symbiodinium natans TaxID=878477 RepID=A0A812M200_9DINO|nr:unnamed protein product [Symbiodinium natans]